MVGLPQPDNCELSSDGLGRESSLRRVFVANADNSVPSDRNPHLHTRRLAWTGWKSTQGYRRVTERIREGFIFGCNFILLLYERSVRPQIASLQPSFFTSQKSSV